jgi:hypothetical protein
LRLGIEALRIKTNDFHCVLCVSAVNPFFTPSSRVFAASSFIFLRIFFVSSRIGGIDKGVTQSAVQFAYWFSGYFYPSPTCAP